MPMLAVVPKIVGTWRVRVRLLDPNGFRAILSLRVGS